MTIYGGDAAAKFCSVSMVTATPGANDPEVGTIVREGDEIYQFVYNAGNSQISPGYCCTVSGVSGYSVTVSMTAAIDFPVGIVKHATLTTATYGFVLKKGFGQVQMGANNSIAAAGILVASTDGVMDTKSISTGYPAPSIGKAMAAIASNASGTAYICIY